MAHGQSPELLEPVETPPDHIPPLADLTAEDRRPPAPGAPPRAGGDLVKTLGNGVADAPAVQVAAEQMGAGGAACG